MGGAHRRRLLASNCAGARERLGAACTGILPDSSATFPTNHRIHGPGFRASTVGVHPSGARATSTTTFWWGTLEPALDSAAACPFLNLGLVRAILTHPQHGAGCGVKLVGGN